MINNYFITFDTGLIVIDIIRIDLFNNCGIGIKGIAHISEGLSENGVSLQILALARNRAEF